MHTNVIILFILNLSIMYTNVIILFILNDLG